MIIADKNGSLIADQVFTANISQLSVYEGYVYLLTENGIARIQPQTLSYDFIKCSTQGKSILIPKEDEVLLCGGQSAIYYQFD